MSVMTAGRHSIDTEHEGWEVPWPVVYMDARRGWVRELPTRDAWGLFLDEQI